MVQIGTYNYLVVKGTNAEGLILSDGEQDVMMPEKTDAGIGEELFVFVYHHQDGRIMATSKRPYAAAGDFAYLKVIDETDNGSFMDIGIEKDLFVPASKQEQPLQIGKKYVVYVYVDQNDGKLTATTWLDDKVDTDLSDLEEGDEVSLLICDTSDLGYSAIINNKYMGLLYRNEVYEELHIGELRVGYIKKIRPEDNKVDLSMRPIGFDFILDSRDAVLDLLKETGGVLNLGDKSSPEDIRQQLKMSKKAFKQVIGGLYKQRLITISDEEIRLVPKEHDPEAE
jgi:predicted RNA-binding protein (virulence factor B family)